MSAATPVLLIRNGISMGKRDLKSSGPLRRQQVIEIGSVVGAVSKTIRIFTGLCTMCTAKCGRYQMRCYSIFRLPGVSWHILCRYMYYSISCIN